MHNYTKKELMALITGKLRRNFGRDVDEATSLHMFKACALVLRDILSDRQMQTQDRTTRNHARQVHYLSLEFLMGRSLMKNAYNLGVLEPLKEAIEGLGFSAPKLVSSEPDAGLGNGGLGRLAACYLDSMTTPWIFPPRAIPSVMSWVSSSRRSWTDSRWSCPTTGWVWATPGSSPRWTRWRRCASAAMWRTCGTNTDASSIRHTGYDSVLAVPKDMEIAGYGTEHVNVLRLWDSKSPQPVDMSLLLPGRVPQGGGAPGAGRIHLQDPLPPRTITTRANPCASSSSTSLSRPPFNPACVSTGPSTALPARLPPEARHPDLDDTHPTLVIPELMRILLDEEGYGWDEALNIVTHTVAYADHTVLAEALERCAPAAGHGPAPRIWQIIVEISNRYPAELTAYFHGDMSKVERMAVIWGGDVRMANLCICACFAVNGVSALHSDILKREVFHDACLRTPGKFKNVTNGIDRRRWLR